MSCFLFIPDKGIKDQSKNDLFFEFCSVFVEKSATNDFIRHQKENNYDLIVS